MKNALVPQFGLQRGSFIKRKKYNTQNDISCFGSALNSNGLQQYGR